MLVPHPIEQHAVRLSANLYSKGYSALDIANYLNTSKGGLALLVQSETITPVWLDRLTKESVQEQV